MNIHIYNVKTEQGFLKILDLESQITKAGINQHWPFHIGGLISDRFLFGNGADDFFDYGKLIYLNTELVGYTLCYVDENMFMIRLLPEYEHLYKQAIVEIERLFVGAECSIVANTNDSGLLTALERYQYQCEERFQAVMDLSIYQKQNIVWENQVMKCLNEKDIKDRAFYGHIATGEKITEQMYCDFMQSPYYAKALDDTIHEKSTGAFMGFVTWWMDENSHTALLEPVACLPEFRRQGIMKKALFHGLNALKDKGITTVYVSTSIDNTAAQSLYLSVGFQKTGTANRYTKSLK